MMNLKDNLKKINKTHLLVSGVLLLILLAVSLLWFNNSTSVQADSTVNIELHFRGEYRIGDGEWKPYVAGEHIPSTKGDVTLRGNLYKSYEGEDLGIYRYDPSDEMADDLKVAFYTNHINLTFIEVDEHGEKYPFIIENEYSWFGDSQCGKNWTAHGPQESIEVIIHNPHAFGNETAIDEMLSSMSLWMGIEFEKGVLDSGATERNIGLFFVMVVKYLPCRSHKAGRKLQALSNEFTKYL